MPNVENNIKTARKMKGLLNRLRLELAVLLKRLKRNKQGMNGGENA